MLNSLPSDPEVLFQHGGRRRDPNLLSDRLTRRECVAILTGAAQAEDVGKPLNRFITILWERGGVEADEAVAATRQFLKLAADWMRPKDGPLSWIYVHEGGKRNGAHAHLMLHVPPDLDPLFRVMPRRWVDAILPGDHVAGVVQTKRVRGAIEAGALYRHDLMQKAHYMLKAAPPELEGELGLLGRGRWGVDWGQSSSVIGKRAGRWQPRRGLAPSLD